MSQISKKKFWNILKQKPEKKMGHTYIRQGHSAECLDSWIQKMAKNDGQNEC